MTNAAPNLLAFDTSTDRLSVAVQRAADGQRFAHTGAGGAQSSATLIPTVQALLAQAGLLDAALMMSEATLPGEQCWRRLREVSDDQPLPYFSTILVNKQWEEA